jgi:hypothetical protein
MRSLRAGLFAGLGELERARDECGEEHGRRVVRASGYSRAAHDALAIASDADRSRRPFWADGLRGIAPMPSPRAGSGRERGTRICRRHDRNHFAERALAWTKAAGAVLRWRAQASDDLLGSGPCAAEE